jgi:UPF0755 protein
MRLVRYLLVVFLVLAVVVGAFVYSRLAPVYDTYQAYQEPEVFVDVPPGAGPIAIGQRLAESGVVRDPQTFRTAVWLSGRSRDLKAGEYRFDRPMTALEVVDKIARGDVHQRFLTFREGLTIAEMAHVYEEAGFGSASEFLAAASDPTPIQALDPQATDLEGYLFPETYAMRRGTTAAALVAQMVNLFTRTYAPIEEAAKALGLTVRQTVTLASLIEKETSVPDERPIVSGVFHNRQRIGMPLQTDPTVIYALQLAGRYDGNIRRADLQIDSPYNTYRHRGLPPGPIAAPGKASLEAAVNPADVEYLYFVSRNDGSHVFARTLTEHNRNVQEWQIEYFRQRRQSGR